LLTSWNPGQYRNGTHGAARDSPAKRAGRSRRLRPSVPRASRCPRPTRNRPSRSCLLEAGSTAMSTRTCFRITAAAPSCAALLALASLLAPPGARAEEGMWTFDNLPLKPLEEKYGFTPSPEWIEHVQRAAVRFNDGGSGAFVSDNGLVLTNHHVALGQLQKVSSAKKDYVKDGFYAHAAAEEMKCPDLELNVLMSTEDVTARVLVAIQPGLPPKQQNEQRRAEMARIEKESTDSTGLRSNVIELYQGGEYWLYRYKKSTDVRLVMAPEQQAACYGGDPHKSR